MMRRLSDVAAATGGKLIGTDREFGRVNQDSRKLAKGELFIAIKGANFDGHEFVASAEKLGAAGAMVQRQMPGNLPQVLVQDTRKALGLYGSHWRKQFKLPLVGVTGSSGKTTLKEMVASILKQSGATLATRGNLNNDIGMPLTLLELDASCRYAVIEMGTNHPGEIGYLAGLAAPTVSVITNAGPAHLEFLKDIAGVAKEKGAIYTHLAADGVAVINADDTYAGLWHEMAGKRSQRSFGFKPSADFHPRPDSLQKTASGSWRFKLVSPLGEADLSVSLPGRHNVANALAAAAAATAAGATLAEVREGLAQAPVTAGRLIIVEAKGGARLIDDTYNANPLSVTAAAEFAAGFGTAWAALGDMGELGLSAERLHAETGAKLRAAGIGRLYGLGPMSRHTVEAFGPDARWFPDVDALVRALRAELTPEVTLLVKGSRSMRMERVVEALRSPNAAKTANGDH